jgi:hypothetical protein
MKKALILIIIAAVFQSCKYDCEKVPEYKLWLGQSNFPRDKKMHIPDFLAFGNPSVYNVNDKCQLLRADTVIGNIISSKRRYLAGDVSIVVRYVNGVEVKYLSK